jgi:hypothetical protein
MDRADPYGYGNRLWISNPGMADVSGSFLGWFINAGLAASGSYPIAMITKKRLQNFADFFRV